MVRSVASAPQAAMLKLIMNDGKQTFLAKGVGFIPLFPTAVTPVQKHVLSQVLLRGVPVQKRPNILVVLDVAHVLHHRILQPPFIIPFQYLFGGYA